MLVIPASFYGGLGGPASDLEYAIIRNIGGITHPEFRIKMGHDPLCS